MTYSAHQVAAEVIRYNEFALPPVWIAHYPKEATDGTSETFELVVFSSNEIRERAPYLGKTKIAIGEPTWKTLDCETVEALVGQEVYDKLWGCGRGESPVESRRPTLTEGRVTSHGAAPLPLFTKARGE